MKTSLSGCGSGEPLDKDDITNAYAAAYVNTVDTTNDDIGDLIIYFGLDRFDTNGSAQVGFWFLQSEIGLTDIPSQGGFEFSAPTSMARSWCRATSATAV